VVFSPVYGEDVKEEAFLFIVRVGNRLLCGEIRNQNGGAEGGGGVRLRCDGLVGWSDALLAFCACAENQSPGF